MPTIAMALPIKPDELDSWRGFLQECTGPRRAEFAASRRRMGVTNEKAWLQHGPAGPMELLVIEVDDPARMFAGLASSQDPFDVWFRERVLDLYGIDLAAPPPGPPPEQVVDWSAESRV